MRFIVSIFFILIFLGCSSKEKDIADDVPSQKRTIKIMSYNIQHGVPYGGENTDVNLENIANVIKTQNPDFVALQELDSITTRAPQYQAKELGELTGMYYYFFKAINYQGGAYGIGLLSKFPILAKEGELLPMPNSGEQRAIAIITVELEPGIRLKIASTHLDLNEGNRLSQADKIIEISKSENLPFILCGDLNARPEEATIGKLREEFLFSCRGNECPKTFPSNAPDRTIDYIIMNSKALDSFTSLNYSAVSSTQASDHLPLMQLLTYD